MDVMVRPGNTHDRTEWLRMCRCLWPHRTPAELECGMAWVLDNPTAAVFVAQRQDGTLCGFLEATIRESALGCRTNRVGYIEGWYVDLDMRRQGVGREMVLAAENWARAQGCTEMASDTTNRHPDAPAAHRALGYHEVQRVTHYRKELI